MTENEFTIENISKDENILGITKQPIDKESKLKLFEKFLALWVLICMGVGILLSRVWPAFGSTLNSINLFDEWRGGIGINVPIGICLFFMMYPAMLNLQFKEVKKLGKNPLPIILTLFSNWIIAPLVAAGLAYLFLRGNDDLIIAVILLGSSPCTAMVLVWGSLAGGNQEQNVINTSINTITIMFLYVPIVSLLTGISNLSIDRLLLFITVTIFIGAPLILGVLSKLILVKIKGKEWFDTKYRPVVGVIAMVALLATLIILFSINGDKMIEYPLQLLLVSAPLLLGFIIVVGFNLLITKLFRLQYKEAIITTIIGSSSHFEIAIATALGISALAALGTTMGLFWEVPVMLSLVYLGKWLNKKGFWKYKPRKAKDQISV
ncbi:MAG: arsenic resistance protein [Candidatus Heimdallarchaeota archaeon]|nr:arsenic resistance protein [Candidatus Heimdallarchaeota archaeon]